MVCPSKCHGCARCSVAMLTKTALSVVCALLLCSVLLASVLNVIHIDYEHYAASGGHHRARERTRRLREQYGRVEDSPNNIMWFLQISDIHISIFRDHGRITQFQQFCDHTVKRIKPQVVLATGDLTDAKAKDNMGSSQVKMEWVYYYNIIKESEVTEHTVWLDIRGNHDNFNVESLNCKENYFRSYSVQGLNNARSYAYRDNFNGVDVAFLGIDACPEPGIRRPFNFVGILDSKEVRLIQKLQEEVANGANHTIWFGHYPTTCILWMDEELKGGSAREMVGSTDSTMAYLCGHLHTMGGIVPNMYTMQKSQYLELELSDWKDNRMYRLGAIDHGLFSFVDQQHNDWPLILVTNPKHARYILPEREPLDIMAASSHVRILVFSDSAIEKVAISIDKGRWQSCSAVEAGRPLYACPWRPELYPNGLHNMKVSVKDSEGKKRQIDHPFSLDGTKVPFSVYPRIFLMMDANKVFQAAFGTFLIVSVVPLVLLRLRRDPPRRLFGCSLPRKLWTLSKVDTLFYPLLLYAIYLPFGPWSVGELIDGHIGAIFAWGIIINGSFLPGTFTYAYGSIQLFFVHIPLTLVLATSVDRRLSEQRAVGINRVTAHLPFILLLTVQMLLAYFFWLAYGTLAFLFGPLRTWSMFLSIVLWYKSLTLPPDYCRKLKSLASAT